MKFKITKHKHFYKIGFRRLKTVDTSLAFLYKWILYLGFWEIKKCLKHVRDKEYE